MRLLPLFCYLLFAIVLAACGGAAPNSEGNPDVNLMPSTLPSSTLVSTITIVPSSTIAPSITSQPSASPEPSLTAEPSPTANEGSIMAATLTPQIAAPPSESADERVETLIGQLAAEGVDITEDSIAIEGDFARVTREANGDTIFVFYKWEAGAWNWLSAGSFFDPESAARLGIPESLLP
jgi:hypothetical protein